MAEDTLRQIPGREMLFARFDALLAEGAPEQRLGLLVIDIRAFHKVNNLLGYAQGDRLLTQFYERLRSLSRDRDCVARVGNDQFVFIIRDIAHEGFAILAASKILREMEEPFQLNDKPITLAVAMGIALSPEHGRDIDALLRHAELALEQAKTEQAPFRIYAEASAAELSHVWALETELDKALEQGEFELHYQPKIELRSGRIYGMEALIRWQSAQRGFVRPDNFIPAAENSGQILPITWWVIKTALREAAEWPRQTMLGVAINLSATILHEGGFVETISELAAIWGDSPQRLTLEVTESALMRDPEDSFTTLRALREAGMGVSIDDFGTGYSSLAYFKNIPATELKIDKSFIFNMLKDPADAQIARTIIDMAHGFGLKVVAEGIEDQATFDALAQMGCDYGQGYHMARPMPQQALLRWLAEYEPSRFVTA